MTSDRTAHTHARSRFDELAAGWDSNPSRVKLAAAVCEAILLRVPLTPPMKVLDYGAGTGLITLGLQPMAGSLVAADSSHEMLAVLRHKLEALQIRNVEARWMNLESALGSEAEFDLAVSSMAFHHLRDTRLMAQRLFALLKPGGRVAVADLDSEDGSFHGTMPDVYHLGFDRQEISDTFRGAGFTEARVADAYRMSKPAASGGMREYGIFLLTALRP